MKIALFVIFCVISLTSHAQRSAGPCRLQLTYPAPTLAYEILPNSTGFMGAFNDLEYSYYMVGSGANAYAVLNIKDHGSYNQKDFRLTFNRNVSRKDNIFHRFTLVTQCSFF